MSNEIFDQGLALITKLLNDRIAINPLTEEENAQIAEYRSNISDANRCNVHPFPDLQYCKACKGIGTAVVTD